MKFAELNIKDDIKRAIEVAGYVDGTIIQENTIDTIMAGKDVLAQAPTGTGKTAAFVVPTLNKLDFENKNIQVCVLAPTRELVVQIVNEFGKLGRYFQGFNVVGIYGGQEINKQFKQLDNKPQIVVCTPGRLSDHLKRKTISLANVQTLILDEVDEMLSMGFARDVHNIIMQIKVQHQTLMFSATMSRDVMDASKKYQSEPYFYKDPASNVETSANVEQFYIKVNKNKKVDLVTRLIKDNQFFMTIIFVNTKKQAK
jgi:ATP-dependent RNA helicase DeaD